MSDHEHLPFDLDAMLSEIADDQKVDREARRLLSQDDIRRLIEKSRRRETNGNEATSP
ncbi:MAG TPA: hypothetical protein PK256_06525 [Verrucomicrobiota bacterium]|nr:hypothetical protein [Verrucomicrobiota bacterium]